MTQAPASAAPVTGFTDPLPTLHLPSKAVKLAWPIALLMFYLMMITVFGKGPTYLIYPPFYLGEVCLAAAGAWCIRQRGWRRFFLPDESGLTLLILSFILLGAVRAFPGVREYGMETFRDSAMWYYALYYFIGMEVARRVEWTPKIWHLMAIAWVAALVWGLGSYLLTQMTGFGPNNFGPILPWRGERLFGNSGYELVQHMALGAVIILNPRLRLGHFGDQRFLLIPIGILGLLESVAAHGRGVRLGLAFGILLTILLYLAPGRQLFLSRRFGLGFLFTLAALAAGLLVAPDAVARQTNLSRFTGGGSDQANTRFRLIWWSHLFAAVNAENPVAGLGFGQSLNKYNPIIVIDSRERWPVRSPHNINITFFSRMGYLGLINWLGILTLGLGGLFTRIWRGGWRGRAYAIEQREQLAFWLVMLAATWGNSSFGVLMEGPVLGVWFWFALGYSRRLSQPPRVVQTSDVSARWKGEFQCAY